MKVSRSADANIVAEGLSKTFSAGGRDVLAVRGAALTVLRGEFVALMGPSGCGKSTLLLMLAGLLVPDEGTVTIDGESLFAMGEASRREFRRAHIGVVFQEFNLLGTLTALENVMLVDELGGRDLRAARRNAAVALADLGLAGLGDCFPHELSGGERQRVAIARAVASGQRVILADEPTGALDSMASDAVVNLLATVAHDGGAVLVVTHDENVAARSDRVLTMRDGVLVGG